MQKGGTGSGAAEKGDRVPLILITHATTENSIRGAANKIDASGIADVEAVIRVES